LSAAGVHDSLAEDILDVRSYVEGVDRRIEDVAVRQQEGNHRGCSSRLVGYSRIRFRLSAEKEAEEEDRFERTDYTDYKEGDDWVVEDDVVLHTDLAEVRIDGIEEDIPGFEK